MVETSVIISSVIGGTNFILWSITTYLAFFRNKPKLDMKVPHFISENNEWHIYVYNEGNRATRMIENRTYFIIGKQKFKGTFRPENRKEYFTANPGEYHHFYSKYEISNEILSSASSAKIFLEMKYDDGRRTKKYRKKVKLDKDDFLQLKERIKN